MLIVRRTVGLGGFGVCAPVPQGVEGSSRSIE